MVLQGQGTVLKKDTLAAGLGLSGEGVGQPSR